MFKVCVTVYSKAATTTFERRYGLPSTISSYISLCYNAAGVVGLLFTSLYGNRMHRPRMLGIGGLMVAAGAVLATLPQFLSPPYKGMLIYKFFEILTKQASKRDSDRPIRKAFSKFLKKILNFFFYILKSTKKSLLDIFKKK